MKFRHLVAATGSTLALLGIPAAAHAAAGPVATTLPAVQVTATSAYLVGDVATGGALSIYEFQFGTTASYGTIVGYSAIPAGKSTVVVATLLTKLKPSTTYHFRLAAEAFPKTASGYYYAVPGEGSDVSFKTLGAGSLKLSSSTFSVKQSKAGFSLKCSSTLTCKGKYSATVKSKKKTVTCVSGTYSIGAGKSGKFSPKVSKACLALVAKAKQHKLTGVTFTATSSTGQSKLTNKKVTLKS